MSNFDQEDLNFLEETACFLVKSRGAFSTDVTSSSEYCFIKAQYIDLLGKKFDSSKEIEAHIRSFETGNVAFHRIKEWLIHYSNEALSELAVRIKSKLDGDYFSKSKNERVLFSNEHLEFIGWLDTSRLPR